MNPEDDIPTSIAKEMRILVLTIVVLFVGASGCNSNKIGKKEVALKEIRDAITPDLPGWHEGILPKANWPDRIREIKPLRVYSHRANRVIALSQRDNVESGYYVYVTISSYLPDDNQEWTFKWVEENIWTYTRKLSEPQR